MGEGGVGRWQERSKKEKQGLGYIWGCMEHCGAGILCSSGSCSVSWRQVSSWTGLVSFLIFCLPTGTSRNSEPWAGTLVGVVRSGCLFLCWTPDYQQTSTSGHISSRWGGGHLSWWLSWVLLLPLTLSGPRVLNSPLLLVWGHFTILCWFPWTLPMLL